MNELIDQIHEEARSAWRFRWFAMAVAAIVALVGWLIVFALPDKYEASASVFVDTRTALKPVLQGLAVEEDVSSQLNYVRQSLLSGAQLEKIAINSGVLGTDVTDPRKKSQILADFAEAVVIKVRSASGREDRDSGGAIYSIDYPDSNRIRSLKVVEIALKSFIEETLGGKRESSENTQKFLETQIKIYEQRLRTAEDSLADFKKNNIGLMPTEQGGYFTQLQAEIDAAKKAENDLSVAVSRRAELTRQLRGEAVVNASLAGSAAPGTAGGSGSADTASRIKETQARLDDLLLRFTDRHPDVIAARAALVELKQRRDAEIEGLRRGDASAVAASGVSSNPVYQSIQLSLNQADVEIASLRGQLGQHQAKAADLHKRLNTAPQVEAQFAQLTRDYDTNKAQYTALLASYEKARLGEQAGDAASVRFEIVQPPTASYAPVSPRRVLLLAGILAGAIVAGGGLAYLMHLLWPVVSSTRDLSALTGLPVLGVVSAAFPEKLHAEARRDMLRFGTAAAGLFIAFAVVIVLNQVGVRLAFHAVRAG